MSHDPEGCEQSPGVEHDPSESDQVPVNTSEDRFVDPQNELETNSSTSSEDRSGRGQNLILTGLMGAGKSTVGRLLARLSGFGFVDLDEQIEKRQGRRVYDIFRDRGEEAFRAAELEALAALTGIRSHVIATGGGTPIDDRCWRKLSELGHIIWLDTSVDVIAGRLSGDIEAISNRPLLDGLTGNDDQQTLREGIVQRLNALRQQRQYRYSAADFVVSEGYSTPDTTARLVLELLSRSDLIEPGTVRRALDRWQNL